MCSGGSGAICARVIAAGLWASIVSSRLWTGAGD
jgi:hypothetical protein